jgi:hypothetical protein
VTVLSSLLPGSRTGRIIAFGATVDAVASGLFLASATLYFVGYLGLPAVAVGEALAVANLVGLVSPIPFGALARRVGPRRVHASLSLVRACGFVGYLFVHGFTGYLVATCVLAACTRANLPLLQVIVAEFEAGSERTRVLASLRAVGNIGLTAGFMLAALAQAVHSRTAFLVVFGFNALAFVVVSAAVTAAGRIAGPAAPVAEAAAAGAAAAEGAGPAPAPDAAAGAPSPYRDRRFLVVAAANAVLLLHDCVLFVLLPLWIVRRAGLPADVSSVLLAVNTVLTVLLQTFMAKRATSVQGIRGALRLVTLACGLLVGACALFAVATGHGAGVALGCALLAVVLLTAGENLHAVAGWELSYELSPPSDRARYLSLFGMGLSAQLIVGPFLMTAVLLPAGAFGWLLLAALFLCATAATVLAARPAAGRAAAPLLRLPAPAPVPVPVLPMEKVS